MTQKEQYNLLTALGTSDDPTRCKVYPVTGEPLVGYCSFRHLPADGRLSYVDVFQDCSFVDGKYKGEVLLGRIYRVSEIMVVRQ